jgi:uncharacterized protein YndB with AHSA1/START domain
MSDTPQRKHHGRVIDTSVRINTTPQRAWEAWADPQQIANWFVDRAEGVAAPGEVMTWFFDTFNYRLPVPIVEATPGGTFVTGSGDQPGPHGLPYLMEITISRDGDGVTVVRLVNSGFSPDAKFDDEFAGVVSGWKMALATKKYWLEHHPNARRFHAIVIEPATYTAETLRPLFHAPEGRECWLHATPRTGADAVLADTGTEVLLSCPERNAVVGLKAFRMGPQPVVALDFSAWGDDPAGPPGMPEVLRADLARLKLLLG